MRMTGKWKDMAPIVRTAGRQAISDAGEFILDEANKKVPHDEGHLERSGITTMDPTEISVTISYDTPYAVRLHEHPEYNFQKGRQGKWLEDTINQKRSKIEKYIAEKVKGAME